MGNEDTVVGFVGLGVMGANMAKNLGTAGYQMVLYDIKDGVSQSVASEIANANVADTPKQLASKSDIVLTMLPNGEAVRDVVFNDNGLFEGYRPGALHIDTSSAEPWITKETALKLEKKQVGMVDAPVSGAEIGAKNGDLVFMMGGDSSHIDLAKPVLEAMGNQMFHLGPIGSGHMMKCVNNLITAVSFMATAEGLAIGKRNGLNPEKMIDVLNVSTGMSWNSINHFKQRIFSGSFDDPFRLSLMVKDIGIAMNLAGESEVTASLSEKAQEMWNAANLVNSKDASISQVVHWVEENTGVRFSGKSD